MFFPEGVLFLSFNFCNWIFCPKQKLSMIWNWIQYNSSCNDNISILHVCHREYFDLLKFFSTISTHVLAELKTSWHTLFCWFPNDTLISICTCYLSLNLAVPYKKCGQLLTDDLPLFWVLLRVFLINYTVNGQGKEWSDEYPLKANLTDTLHLTLEDDHHWGRRNVSHYLDDHILQTSINNIIEFENCRSRRNWPTVHTQHFKCSVLAEYICLKCFE